MNRLIDLERELGRKTSQQMILYATQKGEFKIRNKSLQNNAIQSLAALLDNWAKTRNPQIGGYGYTPDRSMLQALIHELNQELRKAGSNHKIDYNQLTQQKYTVDTFNDGKTEHKSWRIDYSNFPLILLDCLFEPGTMKCEGPLWITIHGPSVQNQYAFQNRHMRVRKGRNLKLELSDTQFNRLMNRAHGIAPRLTSNQTPQQKKQPRQKKKEIFIPPPPPSKKDYKSPSPVYPNKHPQLLQSTQPNIDENIAYIPLKNEKNQKTKETVTVAIQGTKKPILGAVRVDQRYLKFVKKKNSRLLNAVKQVTGGSNFQDAKLYAQYQKAISSQSIPELVVNLHNFYRNIHGTNNVQWDQELAKTAQNFAWAQSKANPSSLGGHTTPHGVGENIYYNPKALSSPSSAIVDAINSWYEELRSYDFSTGNLGKGAPDPMVGHFTQLIWHGTTKVGCGVAKASNGRWHVYCHYTPSGNGGNNRSEWINYVPLPILGKFPERLQSYLKYPK